MWRRPLHGSAVRSLRGDVAFAGQISLPVAQVASLVFLCVFFVGFFLPPTCVWLGVLGARRQGCERASVAHSLGQKRWRERKAQVNRRAGREAINYKADTFDRGLKSKPPAAGEWKTANKEPRFQFRSTAAVIKTVWVRLVAGCGFSMIGQ